MENKKVYIIAGAGGSFSNAIEAGEKLRKILELQNNTELIFCNSIEDVPLNERLNTIQQVHEIKMNLIETHVFYNDKKKKRKHERPYRYHKYLKK